jgi:hypothetical protein
MNSSYVSPLETVALREYFLLHWECLTSTAVNCKNHINVRRHVCRILRKIPSICQLLPCSGILIFYFHLLLPEFLGILQVPERLSDASDQRNLEYICISGKIHCSTWNMLDSRTIPDACLPLNYAQFWSMQLSEIWKLLPIFPFVAFILLTRSENFALSYSCKVTLSIIKC